MLFLKLWNYLHGYVIIVVEGYFLEKFINICIHRQIFLWDIKRNKNSTMTLKISIKGFKLIKPIARKTTCRIHILDKKGVPFLLNRYRKRKAFVLGVFLFLALVYTFSSFIWVIEIKGNERVKDNIIIRNLADMGIRAGTLKYGIDTETVVNKLMLKNGQLAWVGVEVKGTKLKVDVSERIKKPKLVPLDKPCDIIATRDGLIKNVVAKEGQEAVKAGDTVIRGQLLISGTVVAENEEKTTTLVHAIGEVYARTWYEDTAPVMTTITEKILTGKTSTSRTLVLFRKKLKIPFGKVHFDLYTSKQHNANLRIGKDLIFPFGIIINKSSEYKIVKKVLPVDKAQEMAMDRLYKKVRAMIPENAEVVNTKKDFVENETGLPLARVSIECLEDIGITREIGGK